MSNPKPRIATAWLDGCSGCHMSVLDIDERIIELSEMVDFVYSPIADVKDFPDDVTVAIVEGAVSSEEDLHKIKIIREKSKILVSLGDCAVNSNVPGMRNMFRRRDLFQRAYFENAETNCMVPTVGIPALLPKARPIHEIVKVDVFIPGCPPPADAIFYAIGELLAGRIPNPSHLTRFGR